MKSAEDVAAEIVLAITDEIPVFPFNRKRLLVKEIAQALTAFAEERVKEALAKRDLEQFGESFVLNGKRIGPNEIYKSTADYVKEARAEALEEAAKMADEHSGHGCECAYLIRALKEKP